MTAPDNVIPFEARVAAVEQADQPAEPSALDRLRAALVTTRGLDDIPEPEPLVGKIMFRDSLVWLYGQPGCGKSFIALDVAGCVASGEPWQGWFTQQGPVLYLVAEGATGIKQRVRAWEQAMGQDMDGVHFLPIAVQASNATEWQAFVDLAAELRPALVIVDTQARVTVGLEENSNKEMGEVVHRLDAVRRASGACVLVVHHTGRAGEHMRGAIALDGAAHTVIKAEKDDDTIMVTCDKQKDASEFDRFALRMVPTGTSITLCLKDHREQATVDTPATRRLVAGWWDTFETEWVSMAAVLETTGTARASFYRAIKTLVDAQVVQAKGEGSAKRYRLTRGPAE